MHVEGQVAHAAFPASGSVSTTRAPLRRVVSNCNEPPCAVAIDRQIASPSPSPVGLVLTNGLNALFNISGLSPCPLSETASSPNPSARRPTAASIDRLEDGS